MMKENRLCGTFWAGVALAVSLLCGSASADIGEANVKTLKFGEDLPLTRIPANVYLRVPNDPEDIIWERVPEYQIDLVSAPPVHPSVALRQAGKTETIPVYVSAASDGIRLYIKMRWRDKSRNARMSFDTFSDAAAVQFALGAAEKTSIMMGSPDAPVNIWYWRAADNETQDLAAGGFGSLTQLPDQQVAAASVFRHIHGGDDNQWTVVFSRPLNFKGEHAVSFESNARPPVSFAIWQGANKQRDGLKVVSLGWLHLDLASLGHAAR